MTRENWPETAVQIAEEVRDRRISAREIVETHLSRLRAVEPEVRAFAHVAAEDALERAAAVDRDPSGLPLAGVPVGVKDVIDTSRMPTEHGTPVLAGRRPATDAVLVARLEAAGAIVLGKTITNEFGASQPGPTRNPHDVRRTPGGSSSGSAAATAAGVTAIALGTQTGGSIVRPASFCGVFGMKPTLGLLDRTGVGGHTPTIDTPGLMARSAADLLLALEVLSSSPLDVAADVRAWRIGVLACDPSASEELRSGLELTAERLGREVRAVEAATDPLHSPELLAAPITIIRFETAKYLGPVADAHGPLLSERLRRTIETGRAIPEADHSAAVRLVEEARKDPAAQMGGFDALLSLTVTHEAPEGLEDSGDPVPHRIWSALGLPVLSIPMLRGPSGLPVGVQLIGRYRSERGLLALATALHGQPAPTARW